MRKVPTLLPADRSAALESAPFTYDAVGATETGDVPRGVHWFSRSRTLARRDFEEAVEDLLGWRVQARSGLAVAASAPRAEPGAVVRMRLGVPPLQVTIPCRVVYVVDEPHRAGFAYGSLPGHPERGEEVFLLERAAEGGALTFTVAAFSEPATLLTRAGGPAHRAFQRFMTGRYLTALDR